MYQQKSKEAAADPIGTRLRTLLLLMRGSGLAICDAVTLEREPLNKNGELLLYRAKDWNASSCKAAAGCGEGIARSAAWSKTETALLLLEWKRREEKRVADWQRAFRLGMGTNPCGGLRLAMASSSASVANRLAMVRSSFQPTILRENASKISAGWTNSVLSRMYVISANLYLRGARSAAQL